MASQLNLGVDSPSPLIELQARLGVAWPHIEAARESSDEHFRRLGAALHPLLLYRTDATCVVFGSLARREFTSGSDIDWTLLVDGDAEADHLGLANRLEGRLQEAKLRPPTKGGAFGQLTFSHDLVHRIGGDDDTNRNTTQRLLLLLESAPIGNADAYERVVRQVLTRYVEEDLVGARDTPYGVPRFLLNDVVRYWRTMTVDFAHKRRARNAEGWALRTAKLRMSRKLMYTSGVLRCFSCGLLLPVRDTPSPFASTKEVVDYLLRLVKTTPLDIVAGVVQAYFEELSDPAVRLFGVYDEFLGLLNDAGWRKHLENLAPEAADDDAVYQNARELGGRFESALTEIFFDQNTPLRDLTRRYGMF
jgi:hypothetical protein